MLIIGCKFEVDAWILKLKCDQDLCKGPRSDKMEHYCCVSKIKGSLVNLTWRQVGRGWVKYFTFYSRAKVELGVILNDVVHVKIFEPGLS